MIETFKQLRDDRATAAALLLAIVLLISVSFGDEQNWPFIAFYVLTALYAAWKQVWLAFVTAAAVVIVRTMVELEVTGFVFQLASVVFATLFLLLVHRVANPQKEEK